MGQDKQTSFDLIVIGAGPGGYVGAIRAAQLGMNVAVIEKRAALGGTCLNVGCIPSKAMLQSSEYYHLAAHEFADHGIKVTPKLDLGKMQAKKDKTVAGLTKGIEFLFKKNKITSFTGAAKLAGEGKVKITDGPDKGTELTGDKIMIATGSSPANLPDIKIDEKQVVTSTGALEFDKVPSHLAVIGAGVIGLELGSVWQRLGAKVTVIEYLPRILPGMDSEIAGSFQKILTKQGLAFKLSTKLEKLNAKKSGVTLELASADDAKKTEKLEVSHVLVAVGRKPYSEGLGLDALNIEMDKRGFIKVDENYQTSCQGVYAIGDVIEGPMLAHKAEEDGVTAVELMAGQKPHFDYNLVPGVVYCQPELANIGLTEDAAKEKGLEINVGKFPLIANSRAKAAGGTEGMVKLIADKATDRLLGCHIIGPAAGELIHEAAILMEFGGAAEDMARTCHAHPTYAEAMKEAAMATAGRAIHM